MSSAKYTGVQADAKPVEVRTMADVRFEVWKATGEDRGVSIDGGRVFQNGEMVGRLEGEVKRDA